MLEYNIGLKIELSPFLGGWLNPYEGGSATTGQYEVDQRSSLYPPCSSSVGLGSGLGPGWAGSRHALGRDGVLAGSLSDPLLRPHHRSFGQTPRHQSPLRDSLHPRCEASALFSLLSCVSL